VRVFRSLPSPKPVLKNPFPDPFPSLHTWLVR
jgi:hypothetical protein